MDQTTNNDQDNLDKIVSFVRSLALRDQMALLFEEQATQLLRSYYGAITERNYVLRGGFFLSNLSRTPQSSPLLVNKTERLRIGLLCYSWPAIQGYQYSKKYVSRTHRINKQVL